MRVFDTAEIQALAAGPRFVDQPVERLCPACGKRGVRTYMYGSDRQGRPTIISYTWCTSCRRYHGSVGPRPDGLRFNDPLSHMSRDERKALERKGAELFRTLDELWNSGALPQQFDR